MKMRIYVARHGQDVDNANGILNGHRDEPLTDLGREQAKDVASKMFQAGMRLGSSSSSMTTTTTTAPSSTTQPPTTATATVLNLKAIYSSPLRRARETAEIFATVLSASSSGGGNNDNDARVVILNDLIERNFGVFTGRPTSSILDSSYCCCLAEEDVLVTEKINYFLKPPGAETFPELMERAKRLLARIIRESTTAGEKNASSSSTSVLLVTHGDFGKMLYAAYYNLPWEEVLKQFHFGNSEIILLDEDSSPDKAHIIFETCQFNS